MLIRKMTFMTGDDWDHFAHVINYYTTKTYTSVDWERYFLSGDFAWTVVPTGMYLSQYLELLEDFLTSTGPFQELTPEDEPEDGDDYNDDGSEK